jgi:hypothetical protein
MGKIVIGSSGFVWKFLSFLLVGYHSGLTGISLKKNAGPILGKARTSAGTTD